MPLNVEIEKLPDGVAVVTMQGQLTLGLNLKLADSQVHAAIAEGANKLVFDLTDLDYIDSAGLGMLVFTYGTLNEKGGTLRLCGVASRIASVLKLTKTDELMGMDATRAESLCAGSHKLDRTRRKTTTVSRSARSFCFFMECGFAASACRRHHHLRRACCR